MAAPNGCTYSDRTLIGGEALTATKAANQVDRRGLPLPAPFASGSRPGPRVEIRCRPVVRCETSAYVRASVFLSRSLLANLSSVHQPSNDRFGYSRSPRPPSHVVPNPSSDPVGRRGVVDRPPRGHEPAVRVSLPSIPRLSRKVM